MSPDPTDLVTLAASGTACATAFDGLSRTQRATLSLVSPELTAELERASSEVRRLRTPPRRGWTPFSNLFAGSAR